MTLPANTDRDHWVSWDQYHELIERLALIVHESEWKFDKILCLARGGVRVGDVLSRIFDVPLGILATSSYREAAGTVQGQLRSAECRVAAGRVGRPGPCLLLTELGV